MRCADSNGDVVTRQSNRFSASSLRVNALAAGNQVTAQ